MDSSSVRALTKAVQSGRVETLSRLVPSLIETCPFEDSDLVRAMALIGANNRFDMASLLLCRGLPRGEVALMAAVRSGYASFVDRALTLYGHRVNVNQIFSVTAPSEDSVPVEEAGPETQTIAECAARDARWDILQRLLRAGAMLSFEAAYACASSAPPDTTLRVARAAPNQMSLDVGWGVLKGGCKALHDSLVKWAVQVPMGGTLKVQRGETDVMTAMEKKQHRRRNPPSTLREMMPSYREFANYGSESEDKERRNRWRSIVMFLVEKGLSPPPDALTWLVTDVTPCTDMSLLRTMVARGSSPNSTVSDGRGTDVNVALYEGILRALPEGIARMLLNLGADPFVTIRGLVEKTAFDEALAHQRFDLLALFCKKNNRDATEVVNSIVVSPWGSWYAPSLQRFM